MGNTRSDWDWEDVKAQLRKAGTPLALISKEAGYSRTSIYAVKVKHWPKLERLIAQKIGVSPSTIWPSRYSSKNSSHRRAA